MHNNQAKHSQFNHGATLSALLLTLSIWMGCSQGWSQSDISYPTIDTEIYLSNENVGQDYSEKLYRGFLHYCQHKLNYFHNAPFEAILAEACTMTGGAVSAAIVALSTPTTTETQLFITLSGCGGFIGAMISENTITHTFCKPAGAYIDDWMFGDSSDN